MSAILRFVNEIRRLSRSDIPRDQLFNALVSGLLDALAARTGALWMPIDNSWQVRCAVVPPGNAFPDNLSAPQRQEFIAKAVSTGKPVIWRSSSDNSARKDDRTGNDYLLLVVTIRHEGQIIAVVEIVQRPVDLAGAQRGFVRFIQQICEDLTFRDV
jgi:hypothetical protein